MSFRKPCHMPFLNFIPPLTLTGGFNNQLNGIDRD